MAIEMIKANTNNPTKDALNWYDDRFAVLNLDNIVSQVLGGVTSKKAELWPEVDVLLTKVQGVIDH